MSVLDELKKRSDAPRINAMAIRSNLTHELVNLRKNKYGTITDMAKATGMAVSLIDACEHINTKVTLDTFLLYCANLDMDLISKPFRG